MTAAPQPIRLVCIDSDAPPLFGLRDPATERREGFEPAVAELVAVELGRRPEWVVVAWADLLPVVQAGGADAVLCGQGITPLRDRRSTSPARMPCSTRACSSAEATRSLHRRTCAGGAWRPSLRARTWRWRRPSTAPNRWPSAVARTTFMQTCWPRWLQGEVDAVVDDDVVFVPLGDSDPRFEVAFTVRTGNRWGIGVSKERADLRDAIDAALGRVIADGRHRAAWQQWLPTLDYPFSEAFTGATGIEAR